MAESFGIDPERYDRARPRYPDAMVERIVAGSPGFDVLDVGCGTGIAARQFQAVGCRVLGVEPDARMAAFARRSGVDAEVTTFEAWDPADREFDAVVAGQAWHWVDPLAGAAKAAQALRPGGRLAVFWNVFQPPPDVAEAFSAVYDRTLPGSLASLAHGQAMPALDLYSGLIAKAADGIRATSAFGDPELWRYDWEHTYTRDDWLDLLPTQGIHTRLPPATLAEVLTGIGAAIDVAGGNSTVDYAAVAVTAVRMDSRWSACLCVGVPKPSMMVTSVTIAAPDPRSLADFYSRLLEWPVTASEPPRPGRPPEDGWAQIRPPAGTPGPRLNFEYEAAYVAPVWPSAAGEQQIQTHLDIAVEDLAASTAWAVEMGATLAEFQPQEDVRVLLDPVGHPFCLFAAPDAFAAPPT
jgi:SAM-dependent methyltransferase/catechol 2,3-dioxygenase-like lactoylglutathione lyase family enzyme